MHYRGWHKCSRCKVSSNTVGAVNTGWFPDFVDARSLLKDQSARLRSFFTLSKTTSCISFFEVLASFWSGIENNRSTERMIGEMTRAMQNKVTDVLSQLHKTDMRIRAFFINIK